MKTTSIFLFWVFQLSLRAQLIVGFTGGDELATGPGTSGVSFTMSEPYTINSLGIWAGSGVLTASHAVGIWDTTPNHNLLASVVVTPTGSTDLNGFWYVATAPLTLQSGVTYRLGAQYADIDFDTARGNATSATLAHGTLGDAYLSSGTGFEFPDVNVSGANLGFFGPNAAFLPVPEPAQLSVLAGALLLGWAWGVRERKTL